MPHFKHLSSVPQPLTEYAQSIKDRVKEEIDLENKIWSVSELNIHLIGRQQVEGQVLDITKAAAEESQFNFLGKHQKEIENSAVALYSFGKNSKQRSIYKIAGRIKVLLNIPRKMMQAPQQRLFIIIENAIEQYKKDNRK